MTKFGFLFSGIILVLNVLGTVNTSWVEIAIPLIIALVIDITFYTFAWVFKDKLLTWIIENGTYAQIERLNRKVNMLKNEAKLDKE